MKLSKREQYVKDHPNMTWDKLAEAMNTTPGAMMNAADRLLKKEKQEKGQTADLKRRAKVMNPEGIQAGDTVRPRDPDSSDPAEMKVVSVGGPYGNKVYCEEVGYELYASCFKLVRKGMDNTDFKSRIRKISGDKATITGASHAHPSVVKETKPPSENTRRISDALDNLRTAQNALSNAMITLTIGANASIEGKRVKRIWEQVVAEITWLTLPEPKGELNWQIDTNEPFTPKGETETTTMFFVKANTLDEAHKLGLMELGDADIAIVGVSLIEQ